MRQRLDDPIFAFSGTTAATASVSTTALSSTTTLNSASGGWPGDSAQWQALVAKVESISSQLQRLGLIKGQ